jgi:hypothetical protein
MTTPDDAAPPQPPHKDDLLLDELSDRLDSLKFFRAHDTAQADQILEQFGAQGVVEHDMLDQLSSRAPLAHPDRFPEAHRTALRAIEVFDRNAARSPSTLPGGGLGALSKPVVRLLIGIIVHRHEKRVVNHIRELYALREASSVEGTDEFHALRLGRKQLTRLSPDLSDAKVSLPAFLLGGAVLSSATSFLERAVSDRILLLLLSIVLAAVFLGAFWCILTAAAIARRRTRIALDRPLAALWETIGAAGTPPQDNSRSFALSSGILLITSWLIVPAALAVIITTT